MNRADARCGLVTDTLVDLLGTDKGSFSKLEEKLVPLVLEHARVATGLRLV